MSGISGWLLGGAGFAPHGFCLLWRPELVALHVASDALIALAYFAIPAALWRFTRLRTDLRPSHRRLALLFVIFILSCGVTHLMGIYTLWTPAYGLQAVLKAWTAVISVITAAALPFLVPQFLKIPSPEALSISNGALKAEVLAHQATLGLLRTAQGELEQRVAEQTEDLRIANARFQAALANTEITLFEQDAELRYTWVYNAPLGLAPHQLLGNSETAFMETASAERVQALKVEALESGEPRRAELQIEVEGQSGWFDLRVEPHRLRDGRPGLIASSTDVTAARRHDQHLRTVMAELNHRSKNLLTIVQSIARQTAKGLAVPEAFQGQLGERLRALARTHDVLVEENWAGADLRTVVEGQLQLQLETFPGRIAIAGERVSLPPEAAHYMGLALHELGANATKYGALSVDGGRVEVSWTVEPAAAGAGLLRLGWRETGGPLVVEPERRGFGRSILEVLTPRAMQGEAALAFEPGGVSWTLSAPVSHSA